MKFYSILLSLFILSSFGCSGSSDSKDTPEEKGLTGLWFGEFAETDEDDDLGDVGDVYLISIDSNGMATDYDCTPSGYALSPINIRILDENNTTNFERVTAEESFPRKEIYELSGSELIVTLEDQYDLGMGDVSVESSTFALSKISDIPSVCNDNATGISNVSPSVITANSMNRFDISYSYRIEHPEKTGRVAQLILEVFSTNAQGEVTGSENSVVESVAITDGRIQNGDFSYITKSIKSSAGGTLRFILNIAYTRAPGPAIGEGITGEISPNDTFFTVNVN